MDALLKLLDQQQQLALFAMEKRTSFEPSPFEAFDFGTFEDHLN